MKLLQHDTAESKPARLLAFIFCLLVLMLLSAPSAQASNTQTLPEPAKSTDTRSTALSDLAMHVRDRIARNFDATLQQYGDETLREKFAAISERTWTIYPTDTAWSFFAELAIPLISRADSDTPILAYYHPWSDIFFFTQWELRAEGIKIVDFELLPGSWVRSTKGQAADPIPLWLAYDTFPPAGIARAISESVDAFARRTNAEDQFSLAQLVDDSADSATNPSLAYAVAEHNLSMNLANIDNFWFVQNSESADLVALRDTVTAQLLVTFQSGFEAMLNTATETPEYARNILKDMPMEYLADLEVVYHLREKAAAYVFLAPSGGPNLSICLTLHLQDADWSLTRVDAVPLVLALDVAQKAGD